jgi:hypothetical protein
LKYYLKWETEENEVLSNSTLGCIIWSIWRVIDGDEQAVFKVFICVNTEPPGEEIDTETLVNFCIKLQYMHLNYYYYDCKIEGEKLWHLLNKYLRTEK